MSKIESLNLIILRGIGFLISIGVPLFFLLDYSLMNPNISWIRGFAFIFFIWGPVMLGSLFTGVFIFVNSEKILDKFYKL